jgi:protein O-GlcNAc transferase
MAHPPLARALQAFHEGRLADAEALARKTLRENAADPMAEALMVALLTQAGRIEEAIGWQERVVARQPAAAAEVRRLAGLLEAAGRTAAALATWERAVALEPSNPRGLNNLGKLLTDLGQPGRAVECLNRALDVQPRYPLALNNLGRALNRLSRWDEAVPALERAIEQQPELTDAYHNLATALQCLGRLDEALARHEAADRHGAPPATARLQRAGLLFGLRRTSEALAVFEELASSSTGEVRLAAETGRIRALIARGDSAAACERRPEVLGGEHHAPLLAAYADALLADGRDVGEVIDYGLRAARADPTLAAPHVVLGSAHRRRRALDEALAAYDEALRLDPAEPAALFGRALALAASGPVEKTLAAYESAITADPTNPDVCLAAAAYCRSVKRDANALQAVDLALEHHPDHLQALGERAVLLASLQRSAEALPIFARVLEINPDLIDMRRNYFYAKLAVCEWDDFEATSAVLAKRILDGEPVGAPHAILYHCDDPAALQAVARHEAKLYSAIEPASLAWRPATGRPLRVGYVSPDFRGHPVGELMSHVLEHHDPRRVAAIGYALGGPDRGPVRQKIAASCAEFHALEFIRDEELAERLRADGIDIAVDLAGYTTGNRLAAFAHRLAPVQVSFLGCPASLGIATMDYVIADRVALPDATFFDEKPVYLPGCFFPAPGSALVAKPMARAEAGLPAEGVLYAALHTPQKMNPTFFAVWCDILKAVPGARLWLRDGPPTLLGNLRKFASDRGVDPGRLVFAKRADSLADYRRRFALADLLLDTSPYNAHTTTADALGAGVPVATVPGRTLASRIAGSLLCAAGLDDLCFASLDEYRSFAIAIGQSAAARQKLRERVRTAVAHSTLFDTRLFTANLETAYELMAARAEAGLLPAPIDVREPTKRGAADG